MRHLDCVRWRRSWSFPSAVLGPALVRTTFATFAAYTRVFVGYVAGVANVRHWAAADLLVAGGEVSNPRD